MTSEQTELGEHLLVYGDIGIDMLTHAKSIPGRGHDAKVENLNVRVGGSSANCAAVASRLGLATTFLGFVGTDHFSDVIRSSCDQFGQTFEHTQTVDGNTGITIAILDTEGERTFYSYRGVNSTGNLSDQAMSSFGGTAMLHLSGYSFQDEGSRRNATRLMEIAADANTKLSLDPSYWFAREYRERFDGLLSKAHVIFPNRDETRLLTGCDDPESAAKVLLEMGVDLIVLKLSSEGAYVATRSEGRHVPAIPVTQVTDATGAGDAFCGGYLFAQSIGLDVFESAWIGNTVSSVVIQSYGGHAAAPSVGTVASVLECVNQGPLAEKLRAMAPLHQTRSV